MGSRTSMTQCVAEYASGSQQDCLMNLENFTTELNQLNLIKHNYILSCQIKHVFTFRLCMGEY